MESKFTGSIARYYGVDKNVGNTPLLRLRRLSELTGREILGKAEFMNPGSLAQAAVYTNALTAAQVSDIYGAAVVSAPPTVKITLSGNNVVITYTGTLLSAANVAGPYEPIVGANSPYATPATNAQTYYRTQQ
jgi:hypothetical protein